MSDFSEFFDDFFEESLEHINAIEAYLINYDDKGIDKEGIDAIFRGIHSIKGGSCMFEFAHLTEFSHVLETLLDEVRNRKLSFNDDVIGILFDSVDCLRRHIEQLKKDSENEPLFDKKTIELMKVLLNDDERVQVNKPDADSDKAWMPEPDAAPVEPKVTPQDSGNKVEQVFSQNADSIRIPSTKIDHIINMVGELVITKSMIVQLTHQNNLKESGNFEQSIMQLEHNVRELQEKVMELRMIPIDFVFKRFPRLVRDLSNQFGKKIKLKISGQDTEIDKTMMEKISDPLVHLMRNAIDHGIESPAVRKQNNKPEEGLIELKAYHKGGSIIIEISDDGKGLMRQSLMNKAMSLKLIHEGTQLNDKDIVNLIFHPGLSTAEKVSNVSGRGVGMDVVKKNIESLGGSIDVYSQEHKRTVVSISLPLTLSIIDGQLFRLSDQIYVVPVTSIVELIQLDKKKIQYIAGRKQEVHQLRDSYIPILRLHQLLCDDVDSRTEDGLLIVVESKDKKVGLLVDELLSQQQVVIKSLDENFKRIGGIPAATILGDGRVALILDVEGLCQLYRQNDSFSELCVESQIMEQGVGHG